MGDVRSPEHSPERRVSREQLGTTKARLAGNVECQAWQVKPHFHLSDLAKPNQEDEEMQANGQPSTGLISKSLDWILHPQFADIQPWEYVLFGGILFVGGWMWSKVIKQVLESV